MATLDSEPAFYRLSEELIIMIIDRIKEATPNEGHQQRMLKRYLLNVRLTHPRFAYSAYIQSQNFWKIRLNTSSNATLQDLRALRKIGKFVRRVEFDSSYPDSNVVKAHEYISSGKAELEWSEAMQHMPNATDIMISDHHRVGPDLSRTIGMLYYYVDMYRLATSAMVAAGTKPHSLECHVNSSADLTDPSRRCWQRLDISSLETLRVHEWHLDPKEGFLEHPLPSLAPFLKHLHVFKMEREFWRGTWPDNKRPTMPALESLEVCGGRTDPTKLASWIRKCPKLSTLSLHVYSLGRGTVDEWRPVFDAIREHPRGMHATMSNFVSLGGDDRLPPLEMYTKDMPPPNDWLDPREDYLHELARTSPPSYWEERISAPLVYNYEVAVRLMQYMCGLSEWNLQQWEGLL